MHPEQKRVKMTGIRSERCIQLRIGWKNIVKIEIESKMFHLIISAKKRTIGT